MPKCDTHMRRPLQGNPSHTSYRHANGLWNVQWRLAASGHAMPCSRCALHGLGCFVAANRSGQAAETGDGVWKVGKGEWLIASRYCCTLARMYHFIMGVLRGGGGVMRSTCVVLSCPPHPYHLPSAAVLVSAAGRAGCCCMRLGCASPVQPPRCRAFCLQPVRCTDGVSHLGVHLVCRRRRDACSTRLCLYPSAACYGGEDGF
jgi:hypothetical protein